ncbi:polysaccharide deacetylase family protein [Thermosynechococcus sp.]|uniref:polysaccharide deacetylase family protein n=1 Tax=Thermosynechococcus sp. TaxID=2814275 RepID=UPI00391A3F31
MPQPSPTAAEFININYENAAAYAAKIPTNFVALTFDDGPTREYTLPILAKLRQYGMKATFFVIGGRVAQNCDILQQIYREGHEIGNHTYSHVLLTQESPQSQWVQLVKNQQEIHQCLQQIGVNYYPRWFRAPYGDQNAQVLAYVKALGMNSALWSLDTQDWNIETTATMIANSVIQGGDRQLVIMHDGTEFNSAMQNNPQLNPSRQPTVEALDQILSYYRSKGISSLTLSQAFR